jgi:hypothetical protein
MLRMSNPNYKIQRTLSGIETPKKCTCLWHGKINQKYNVAKYNVAKYGKRFMFGSIVLSAVLVVYNDRDIIFR